MSRLADISRRLATKPIAATGAPKRPASANNADGAATPQELGESFVPTGADSPAAPTAGMVQQAGQTRPGPDLGLLDVGSSPPGNGVLEPTIGETLATMEKLLGGTARNSTSAPSAPAPAESAPTNLGPQTPQQGQPEWERLAAAGDPFGAMNCYIQHLLKDNPSDSPVVQRAVANLQEMQAAAREHGAHRAHVQHEVSGTLSDTRSQVAMNGQQMFDQRMPVFPHGSMARRMGGGLGRMRGGMMNMDMMSRFRNGAGTTGGNGNGMDDYAMQMIMEQEIARRTEEALLNQRRQQQREARRMASRGGMTSPTPVAGTTDVGGWSMRT